jgi:hypothetical protein
MANWDQRGHDYDYSDNHFLAPEPPSGRRPLSTRSPQSNDGRGLARIRRPSFHRDYHSDNEAMMSERLSERDLRDLQYADPEYVYIGQPVSIASNKNSNFKRAPSPPPGNISPQKSQQTRIFRGFTRSVGKRKRRITASAARKRRLQRQTTCLGQTGAGPAGRVSCTVRAQDHDRCWAI